MSRSVTAFGLGLLLIAASTCGAIAQESQQSPPAPSTEEVIAEPGQPASAEAVAPARSVYDQAIAALIARAEAGDAVAALAAGQVLVKPEQSATEQSQGIELLLNAEKAGLKAAWPVLGEAYRRGVGGSGPDYALAIRYYDLATQEGDWSARRTLAGLLLDLRYPTTDAPRAIGLLETAAAEGDIAAAISLAGLYARDAGRTAGGREAAGLYELAVAAGEANAMRSLADLYRAGANGLAVDASRAQALFEALAEKGDTSSARRVAEMMIRGELRGGIEGAKARLELVATGGEPRAYVDLGDLFSRGEYAAIDAKASETYFQKAAEAGLADGYLRLGDLYRSGLRDIRPDAARAIASYEQAAALAAAPGNNRLGDFYRIGAPGVDPDAMKAERYYRAAIEAGDNSARRSLASLYLDGKLLSPDVSIAVPLLNELVAVADAGAAATLGVLFADGRLTQPDYEKAKTYFGLAAKFGDRGAGIRFASLLVEGPLAVGLAGEGISSLSKAVENGELGAASELARLMLAGKVAGSEPQDALSLLEGASIAGDASAGRYLVALYRDGGGNGAIRSDLGAALSALERLKDILPEQSYRSERIVVLAKGTPTTSTLEEIATEFDRLDRSSRISMLQRMSTANPVVYLSQLQRGLASAGLYAGTAGGLLDGATLDAVLAACAEASAVEACAQGPFTSAAVTVLAGVIYSPRY